MYAGLPFSKQCWLNIFLKNYWLNISEKMLIQKILVIFFSKNVDNISENVDQHFLVHEKY
jgi:hypothetical protein